MLKWLVDESVEELAISEKQLIDEDQVEIRQEKLPNALIDQNVDMYT